MIRNKRYSYAVSWEAYVKGNIVSSTSLRYIQNILTATAATKTEDSEDSSDDTDAEQYENFDFKAGSMDLVHQTLEERFFILFCIRCRLPRRQLQSANECDVRFQLNRHR